MSYSRKIFNDGEVLYAADLNAIAEQVETITEQTDEIMAGVGKVTLTPGLDKSSIQQLSCIAGCKGYYIKSIDTTQQVIYLTNTQVVPVIDTIDNTDTSFETPSWSIGDPITIINGIIYEAEVLPRELSDDEQYVLDGSTAQARSYVDLPNTPVTAPNDDGISTCSATVSSISHNVLYYSGDLGFTKIATVDNLKYYDYSICNTSKPSAGVVDLAKTAQALGQNTMATGDGSTASGIETQALGKCSEASGFWTTASNFCSHSEGDKTFALGSCSHVEGTHSWALGDYSHAEGFYSTAYGEGSHSEGHWTVAKGGWSHSEGYLTQAWGNCAHVENNRCIAKGANSHAEGYHTITNLDNQHVQGKFNVEDYDKVHIVGWGDSDTNRKNIHTIDQKGNAWFLGRIQLVEGSGYGTEDQMSAILDAQEGQIFFVIK